METITHSPRETQKLGQKIGSSLVGGEVLALTGELGGGKTTFIQGLAKGLGINQRIISPTFILMRQYEIPKRETKKLNFYHLDLYRFEKNVEQEVKNLGLGDIWTKQGNIVVIEWAEKIKDMVPESATWVTFEHLGNDKRKITIKSK